MLIFICHAAMPRYATPLPLDAADSFDATQLHAFALMLLPADAADARLRHFSFSLTDADTLLMLMFACRHALLLPLCHDAAFAAAFRAFSLLLYFAMLLPLRRAAADADATLRYDCRRFAYARCCCRGYAIRFTPRMFDAAYDMIDDDYAMRYAAVFPNIFTISA